MEDSYVSLVSNFIMESEARLSELEEEEEEDEVDEDFYDFLPFQKEFLIPLRDRAFSWDVSLEDGLHGETFQPVAASSSSETNNPKLVIKAKRMHLSNKTENGTGSVVIKQEKEVKKSASGNTIKVTLPVKKREVGQDSSELEASYIKPEDFSPKLSLVLPKSAALSALHSKNTAVSPLPMKPPVKMLGSSTNHTHHHHSAPLSTTIKQSSSVSLLLAPDSTAITALESENSNSQVVNGQPPSAEEEELLSDEHHQRAESMDLAQSDMENMFQYVGDLGPGGLDLQGGISDHDHSLLFESSINSRRNLESMMMHSDAQEQPQQPQSLNQQQQSISPQHNEHINNSADNNSNSEHSAVNSGHSVQSGNAGQLSQQTLHDMQQQQQGSMHGLLMCDLNNQLPGSNSNSNNNNSNNGNNGGGNSSISGNGLRPMILDGFSSMNELASHQQQGGQAAMHHQFSSFSSGNGGLMMHGGHMGMGSGGMHLLSMGGLGGSNMAGGSGLLGGSEYRIGAYTREERQMKIEAFRAKKRKRIWRKQIKYDCRKRLADTRPRVKGRFVSRKLGDNDDISALLHGGMLGEDGELLLDANGNMLLSGHGLMGGMMMHNPYGHGSGLMMDQDGNIRGGSSKDLMAFQIQQRYASAVYNNGVPGMGGDMMFSPMDPGQMLQQQSHLFMPSMDYSSGGMLGMGMGADLLSGANLSLLGGGAAQGMMSPEMYNEQFLLQQQQLLYLQSLSSAGGMGGLGMGMMPVGSGGYDMSGMNSSDLQSQMFLQQQQHLNQQQQQLNQQQQYDGGLSGSSNAEDEEDGPDHEEQEEIEAAADGERGFDGGAEQPKQQDA